MTTNVKAAIALILVAGAFVLWKVTSGNSQPAATSSPASEALSGSSTRSQREQDKKRAKVPNASSGNPRTPEEKYGSPLSSTAELQARWAEIDRLAIPDNEKMILKRYLIRSGCAAGYFNETLAKILANYGPGMDRSSLTGSVFTSDGILTADIPGLLSLLSNDAERRNSLEQIGRVCANRPTLDGVEQLYALGTADGHKAALGAAQQWAIRDHNDATASSLRDSLTQIRNFFTAHDPEQATKIYQDAMTGIVAGTNSFALWELSTTDPSLVPNDDTTRRGIAQAMARSDTDRALQVLSTSTTDDALASGLSVMAMKDMNKAESWLQANEQNLTGAQKNNCLVTLAMETLGKRGSDGIADAMKFSDQISDEALKAKISTRIQQIKR